MIAHPDAQKGAAVVEMAFVSILLIWMVFGIIDVGRAIVTDIGLKEAAQAGAHHFAFTETANAGTTADIAVASTTNPQLAPGDIDAGCDPVFRGGVEYGRVTVTATHELDMITPIVAGALGGSIELNETAEAERFFPCP